MKWIKDYSYEIIWGLIGLIGLIILFSLNNNLNKDKLKEVETQIKTEVSNINTGEENKEEYISFSFISECDYTGSEYNHIDIATPDNRIYTQNNAPISSYTKNIKISGDIQDAYLCIISDISDKKESYNNYRKPGAYNTITKIKFGNYYGAIFVAYDKGSKQFYDYDSDNSLPASRELYGKFWGQEAPFRYTGNLKSIIIADEENGRYNYQPLINELKNNKTIPVGGFMAQLGANDRWASSISAYRIIYKGGEISIVE